MEKYGKKLNDLATANPKLAREWHPSKNGNLTPAMITRGYDKKVWWLYPYDVPMDYPIVHLRGKHFNFEWESTVNSRTSGNFCCPYLSNQLLWVGFNDLATTNPKLASQWHPTKNGTLNPSDVMAGSVRKVWWYFPYDVPMDYPVKHLRGKHFDFEWESKIGGRNNGSGCPYLTGRAIWIGFNDLATTHPELISQWHPTKNRNLKPVNVMAGSTKKVWWRCTKGHEWKTMVSHRVKGRDCPVCNESKGETAIRKILEKHSISYMPQYKFKDRTMQNSKMPLMDDFAIFDIHANVIGTIEYNGKQHYMIVDFGNKGKTWAQKELEKTKARDKVKSDYLAVHNIPQLIIPYWSFNDIEVIVINFIKELSKKHTLC